MPGRKSVTFNDDGTPMEETDVETPDTEIEEPLPDETGEEPIEETEEQDESEAPAAKSGKQYRIGDQTFDSLEEAHEFATSHINALTTQTEIDNAYRRGIIDARGNAIPPESVTPPEPEFNEEKYYANPGEFLKEFEQKIITKTQAQLDAKANAKAQDDQIWTEFTARHPELADYRDEVTEFTTKNAKEIGAIASLKGRPVAYDHVAVKLKAQFQRYAQALAPRKKLPNGGGGLTPTSRGASVTPKPTSKKPLSFAEQIRQHKRVR